MDGHQFLKLVGELGNDLTNLLDHSDINLIRITNNHDTVDNVQYVVGTSDSGPELHIYCDGLEYDGTTCAIHSEGIFEISETPHPIVCGPIFPTRMQLIETIIRCRDEMLGNTDYQETVDKIKRSFDRSYEYLSSIVTSKIKRAE